MTDLEPAGMDRNHILFVGRSYTVADKLGLMPLLKFAHIASKGTDGNEMDGMAAMYELLHNVIADDQWDDFEAHATATRAGEDELLSAVTGAIQVMTARPTKRPSDLSPGPSSTEPSSPDGSLSLVSSIPAPTYVSPLDERAARELKSVEEAAFSLVAS